MSERTKQDILRAFNRLINSRGVENISVTMISNEAGVSRATFYRHFKDKYDVMNYNYKYLLDTFGNVNNSKSYCDLFTKLFNTGKNTLNPIKYAFESTGFNSFMNYIFEYSYSFAEEVTKVNRDGVGFTEKEKLQAEVFCRGVSHMYKDWVYGKFSLPPDEAAKSLCEMLPESIKNYWWPESDQNS